MVAKSLLGKSAVQPHSWETQLASYLSNILGSRTAGNETLNSAFYAGLRPVAAGLREGTLTEEQATLLFELLISAYSGAIINQQISTVFQDWAEAITESGPGGDRG